MNTVTLATAVEQAKKFSDLLTNTRDISLDTEPLQPLHYHAEYFSRADIEAILSQNECDGIRIYHALDNNEKSILLIVGATTDRDLLPVSSGNTNSINRIILSAEENLRCPPMCVNDSLLNSL